MLYIRYLILFQKNKVQALINSGSKLNVITPVYAAELGLMTQKTSVWAQKIDGLPLATYNMASARFLIPDSLKRFWFFEKTFLLADTNMEVVLGMSFFSLSNANVEFAELKRFT